MGGTQWTPAALADVTNKLASTTALRSLERVKEQLPVKLKPVAQANDYIGIKQALRLPPFDQVRKDLLTVVRGGEDGPKAGELQLAYKGLIKSLEDIDATASIGMGRSGKPKPDVFQLIIERLWWRFSGWAQRQRTYPSNTTLGRLRSVPSMSGAGRWSLV